MKDPKIIDIGNPPDPEEETKKAFSFRPLSSYGLHRWSVFALAALGLLYILNPTFGLIEFIPDNLQFRPHRKGGIGCDDHPDRIIVE